jgi:hypothetical protein
MGICGEIGIKVKPKNTNSEQSYRINLNKKNVKFAENNIFYSDPNLISKMDNIERKAKNLLLFKLLEQELDKDKKFIKEVTEQLLIAKNAMDDCIYDELHSSKEPYSIVPFAEIK